MPFRQRGKLMQSNGGTPLVAATATFIRNLAKWRWWVTLTIRRPMTTARVDMFFCIWLRRLAESMQTHVTASWANGPQGGGNPHFHVLLSWKWDSSIFTEELARILWRGADSATGNVKVLKYKDDGGASWYHAKHPRWDANIACPYLGKCRRNGCVIAPSSL